MRTLIAWTLTLLIGASAMAQGTAPAARKGGQPTAAPVDPKVEKARADADTQQAREEMDRVLLEWEKKSKQIVSLDVLFDRIDRAAAWGDQYYQGRAMLQSPDLACLQFQKYKLDDKGKPLFLLKDGKSIPQLEPEPTERIVCTGSQVLQYSWEEQKIFVFPLEKQARQKALQEGPLPFLFNMKAAETKKRYSMTLLKEEKPSNNFLIGIIPNEEIDKQSFSRAFLWLSKDTYLPSRLRLYTIGNKEFQEFLFTGNFNTIRANTQMNKDFFAAKMIPGWKVIENPGGEPAQGKAAAANKKAAAQPAMNPSPRPRQ